jgi:Uma2 family endonuclease
MQYRRDGKRLPNLQPAGWDKLVVMATLVALPVEKYLRTTYHPDREYVDGQLVERNVGEYFHGRLQSLLGALLVSRERHGRFRTFTETRIRIGPRRYRIPDICVVALPHNVSSILERADLAIEIVSPDDRFSSMLEKIAEYLQAGVAHVWIADPYQRVAFEADSAGVREAPSHRVTTSLTGEVDFGELFAALDEPAD